MSVHVKNAYITRKCDQPCAISIQNCKYAHAHNMRIVCLCQRKQIGSCIFSALNNCVQVSRLHSWFGQGRLSKNGDARFEQELPVCAISTHGCASSLFALLQRTGPCPVCQAKTLTRTRRTNKTLVCSYLQRYNSCHSAFTCICNNKRTNTIRLRLQTMCSAEMHIRVSRVLPHMCA